ncbi:hypothetical protein LTR37_020473 [Vermiconidia calcicola]|uniref:Uncharacterized protein n=1 Tax=Vermiconidia calcicola TaxID=1690605 RepID=A0ACC3ME92_9PEZI|nr:hypothetical protein LTR37_020473 [Vermiconidia calcicola]
MAGDEPKSAIPSWQRAVKQQSIPETTTGAKQDPAASNIEPALPGEVEIPTPAEPAAVAAAEELSSTDATSSSQLANMKTLLEDPAVKEAPREKVRAFFESKGIPQEQIDQALSESTDVAFKVKEFEDFFQQTQPQLQAQRSQTQTVAPRRQQSPSSGPPIITYPEFLVDAHKPPPLITPTRILNTAYIASGLAALIYGASKYLVTPMSDSLAEARHDFAMHSQSKIDEMNEKLSGLVSKVPDTKKDRSIAGDSEMEEDTAESITSDPTELYHRDMGTQTSPPPSRSTSIAGLPDTANNKKEAASSHEDSVLSILNSHLNDFLANSEKLETPNKDRQDAMNKLRHYLDTIMYASPHISAWSNGEGGKDGGKGDGKDAVEELKMEIRGVKGVLLSAKRFPGVAGRVGA